MKTVNKITKTILRLNREKFPEQYMTRYSNAYRHLFNNVETSKYGNMYLEVKPEYKNYIEKQYNNKEYQDFVTVFTNEKEFSKIHIRYGFMDQF